MVFHIHNLIIPIPAASGNRFNALFAFIPGCSTPENNELNAEI